MLIKVGMCGPHNYASPQLFDPVNKLGKHGRLYFFWIAHQNAANNGIAKHPAHVQGKHAIKVQGCFFEVFKAQESA
jgi:hypothetical protein